MRTKLRFQPDIYNMLKINIEYRNRIKLRYFPKDNIRKHKISIPSFLYDEIERTISEYNEDGFLVSVEHIASYIKNSNPEILDEFLEGLPRKQDKLDQTRLMDYLNIRKKDNLDR